MNNKIREALDQSMADVTWKEQNRQRVLHAVRQETLQTRTHRPALVIVLALVLVLFIATAVAGATNEAFNAWLYQQWPELALKLMPVNLSCEDQGIRMEVISAVIQDSELLLTYSLKDLEGDRISEITSPSACVQYMNNYESVGSVSDAFYDPEGDRYIFVEHMKYIKGSEGHQLTVFSDGISSYVKSTVDLRPLLKEYGSQAKLMPVPSGIEYVLGGTDILSSYNGPLPESLCVLDNSNSPEAPVADHIFLSGIGIVDGMLHVQFHYPEYGELSSRYNEWYPVYTDTYLFDTADENTLFTYNDNASIDHIKEMHWSNDAGERWVEAFFTVDQEPGDSQTFETHTEVLESVINGNWEINVPLRLVKIAQ